MPAYLTLLQVHKLLEVLGDVGDVGQQKFASTPQAAKSEMPA